MALTFKSKAAPASDDVPTMLNTEETAKLICLSTDYLKRDRWLANKSGTPPRYPYYKVGGEAVRYDRSEVLAIMKQGRVG